MFPKWRVKGDGEPRRYNILDSNIKPKEKDLGKAKKGNLEILGPTSEVAGGGMIRGRGDFSELVAVCLIRTLCNINNNITQ